MRKIVLTRLPSLQDILPVYAVIAVFVYSWTILGFFWKLPSWILYLTVGEIFSIFSYAMVSDFIESLLFLGLFVSLAAILPSYVLTSNFIVRGTWLVISIIGSMMLGLWLYTQRFPFFVNNIIFWVAGAIIISGILFYFSIRLPILKIIAVWFSDQMLVFLYFLVPLSVLSIFIVIVRNIF